VTTTKSDEQAVEGLHERLPDLPERLAFTGHVPEDSEVIDITSLGRGIRLLKDYKAHGACEEFMKLPPFVVRGAAVDRDISDDHVTYLLNTMKRGTHRPEWVRVVTCVCDEAFDDHPAGTKIRINAQHTATARLLMPADYDCEVRFLHYRCKTVEDVRILYASEDRGRGRSSGQVANAYLAGTDEFAGCPPHVIKALANGLTYWLRLSSKRFKYDIDEVAYSMRTGHRDVVLRVKRFLAGEDVGDSEARLLRAPVVAALLETFAKAPGKASQFWTPVADCIGLEAKTDPRYQLHKALSGSVMSAGTLRKTPGGKVVPGAALYLWCVQCWNAWRDGLPMGELTVPKPGKRKKGKKPQAEEVLRAK